MYKLAGNSCIGVVYRYTGLWLLHELPRSIVRVAYFCKCRSGLSPAFGASRILELYDSTPFMWLHTLRGVLRIHFTWHRSLLNHVALLSCYGPLQASSVLHHVDHSTAPCTAPCGSQASSVLPMPLQLLKCIQTQILDCKRTGRKLEKLLVNNINALVHCLGLQPDMVLAGT